MSTTMTTTNQNVTRPNGGQDHQTASGGNALPTRFSPRFDIWEGDDELILYGDLPGVEPANLDIRFENRQLSIHGKVDRMQSGVTFAYSEYEVGDFQRTFTIGEAINADEIYAEMSDGVLTLHLPKSEEAKPRRIEIKSN